MTDRICEHVPCSNTLEGKRPDARFCSDQCRYDDWDAKHPRKPVASRTTDTSHPLAEVREAQEAAKAEWSTAIYAEIVRILDARGSFHADDLEPMGVPDGHRNLIGAQLGSLAARHYIHEVGRRKSSNPARKQAKSGVYEFTRNGREKLAGVGSANREGEPAAATAPLDRPEGFSPALSPSDGARSSDAADPDEPETLSLLPDEVGRGGPMNPLSHPEAA